MNNVSGLTEIGITVFAGNNLDMQPTDVPLGLSPDNSDVAFLPGSVFTRPSLSRLLTTSTTSQCVYATSFLKPDGTVSQLQFMADGKMYADGVQFGSTQAGNRFHTCNAFNRMFIAISDGLHGADVPLQYTPEGWLDRVSQDGPGAPPTVTNYSLPAVDLIVGSTGSSVSIDTITPVNQQTVQVGGSGDDAGGGYTPPTYETYYADLQVVTSTAHGLTTGQIITISGNSVYSLGNVAVAAIVSDTEFLVSYYTQSDTAGSGGTLVAQNPLLSRTNNQVTAYTNTAHNMRVGYKAKIAGVADATQSVTSIVVDNDVLSGEATVTTSTPHGFVPGNVIKISGVSDAPVGGTFVSYVINSGVALITVSEPHKLEVGAVIIASTNGGTPYAQTVTSVPTPTTFTWASTQSDQSGTTGWITLPWPNDGDTQYTIDTVPSSTTFTFPFVFSGGTWTTGTISFPWDGTFYVTSVPTSTSLIYSQNGPNNSIQTGSGTVTPVGQIDPGKHTCVLIFRTRTGYLTIPSPPVSFTAGGGQYLLVTNIPLGPSNVIERWMAFTGADGGNYFVLPVPPRDSAGQYPIGTSTVVADNTTTSAILDFDDIALMAGIGIDTVGNNLFDMQVLGACLGFFSYGSRMFSWGERNKLQLLRNMGFEGGYLSTATNAPLGWTITGSDGILTTGDYGAAWQATTATISQPVYRNQFGTQIFDADTQFTYRAWVNGTSTATLSSATSGYSSTATITGTGGFAEATFSQKTPVTIPSDFTLTLSQTGTTTIDELEIIYTNVPYLLSAKGSYANNSEALAGSTCTIGPAGDPHPVMGMEMRKDVLCILTAGPEGALYETQQTTSGEPAVWELNHKASKCGLTSVWGTAKFEDWFCWTSDTGLRIFDGANVEKMSQEIQPWWDKINPSAKQFTVLANDPYTRRVYVSAPQGTATVCSGFYSLDYRDLNTASMLANSGTLRIGNSGKPITSDLTRKWSPWSMTINYMGLLTLSTGEAVMAFCGGNGTSISDAMYGAVYELAEGEISGIDADYGAFWQNSRYPTAFLLSNDDAATYQLGKHRLLHRFLTMNCTGVGKVYVVPYLDRLGNAGRTTPAIAVTEDLARDLEFGLNLAAERISYCVQCKPATDGGIAGFRLSSMTLGVTTHPFSPIRGKNF